MRRGLAFLVVLAALAAAPSAYACACCSEKGQWQQFTDAVELRELQRVQFRAGAQLYTTAAGIDGIEGLRDPRNSYPLSVVKNGRTWTFRFGAAGSLAVAVPARGEYYATDLGDGRKSAGGGPLLYKELRLRGAVRGSGDFSGGAYRLILMGRGNSCLNADDFTRWRLELRGANVDYALVGTFR